MRGSASSRSSAATWEAERAEAENIAQSIIFAFSKASLLADIANTLAATDPDRAEHIAQTIADEGPKARALAEVEAVLTRAGLRRGRVPVLAVDTDFHDKIPELLPFRPELRDNFVADPQKAVPNNRMPFAGMPDAADRADLIAYLDTLSASPVPLPKAAAAPATPASEPPRSPQRRMR